MAKNKNITKCLCPVCGTEHYINKHTKIRCLCENKLIVIRNGKNKKLVEVGTITSVKVKNVRCKDCIFFRQKENGIGDCVNIDKMRLNINGECLKPCKRFKDK